MMLMKSRRLIVHVFDRTPRPYLQLQDIELATTSHLVDQTIEANLGPGKWILVH